MNVILLSNRYASPMQALVRTDEDGRFAARLVAEGARVRWIVPGRSEHPTPSPAGVEVLEVETRLPPFRDVAGRLSDPAAELVLAKAIRADFPTAVHLLDYGGGMSGNASWVAERLGARVVATVQAAPLLCHRGQLRDATHSECTDWSDDTRCARCCLASGSGGLSAIGSLAGRMLGAIRSPINPFPTPTAFENRRELAVGGLQFVDCIVVPSESERERVAGTGIPKERIRAIAAPKTDTWLSLYVAP